MKLAGCRMSAILLSFAARFIPGCPSVCVPSPLANPWSQPASHISDLVILLAARARGQQKLGDSIKKAREEEEEEEGQKTTWKEERPLPK